MSDLQMDDHIQRPGIERVRGGTKEVQCGWSLRGGREGGGEGMPGDGQAGTRLRIGLRDHPSLCICSEGASLSSFSRMQLLYFKSSSDGSIMYLFIFLLY